MDLAQVKLTKKEWASVEIPVSDDEKEILRLIQDGYRHVNIRYNRHQAMVTFLKIDLTDDMEAFLYTTYFAKSMLELSKTVQLTLPPSFHPKKTKPLKKIDMMRLAHLEVNIEKQKEHMFEFQLLKFCHQSLLSPKQEGIKGFYTLVHARKANVKHTNRWVMEFVNLFVDHMYNEQVTFCSEDRRSSTTNDRGRFTPGVVWMTESFRHSYEIIEKNSHLLRYNDITLYDHQKQLFQIFNKRSEEENKPVLVLYTAPTGTGKTMSPLGLSCSYRIIYICAARHVGLSLAKSAISMEKCVAFAFGCETASDIRLHYYSAAEYTKNHKTGGIYKVDNSDGRKVEIMICDVASYLIAMYYMLSFNENSNIILYWDEPTIGLDVVDHPLHPTLQRMWNENKIERVVLSCATLPKEDEIADVLVNFRCQFDGAEIQAISSYDCKKTITLLDALGKCVLPHLLFSSYTDIEQCIVHCHSNKSLLRYFDLREIVRFVEYVKLAGYVNESYRIENYFSNIEDVTLMNIKLYYLDILKQMDASVYSVVHQHMKSTLGSYFPSDSKGTLLTTTDAHTLTDGPTIFLAEDVSKIGKFYIQQTKVPSRTLDNIMEKIGTNNQIQKKMDVLLKSLDDAMGQEADKDKKMEKESFKPEVRKLLNNIEALRGEIIFVAMDPMYVPNTRQHQAIWVPNGHIVEHAFVPIIDESAVREIMELDVDTQMKLLLLLGIGVFVERTLASSTANYTAYMEVMKRLSQDQRLFLIIAASDYIYGTNYQLCHAVLGKDLQNMTQQKIIQAMGRVGRSNIQQSYTVRFRDETLITKLFLPISLNDNVEAQQMCRLLKGNTT